MAIINTTAKVGRCSSRSEKEQNLAGVSPQQGPTSWSLSGSPGGQSSWEREGARSLAAETGALDSEGESLGGICSTSTPPLVHMAGVKELFQDRVCSFMWDKPQWVVTDSYVRQMIFQVRETQNDPDLELFS